jgi:hypothetical protein
MMIEHGLTSHTTPGFRCEYLQGMFANEPPNMADYLSTVERVCYHEAGHAVLGYVLGDGLILIEL